MPIKIIAAMSKDTRVIGNDNKLPRSVKEDMKFFRSTIKDQIIVMGKSTYDSLKPYYPDHHGHPLAKENILLTHQKVDGIKTYTNIQKLMSDYQNEMIYIIGGGKVYEQFIDFADEIFLTLIHKKYNGDSFFPSFEEKYHETEKREGQECDFVKYERKK